jgi:hypothetical protein
VFERFTHDARTLVVATQDIAPELGADEVAPVHLLVSLTRVPSRTRDVMAAHGLTDAAVLEALDLESGAPRRPTRPLDEDDAEALRSIGIDLDAIRRAVEERFGEGALDTGAPDATEPASDVSAADDLHGAQASDDGGDDLVSRGRTRGRLRFGPAHVRFARGSKKVLELAVREAFREGARSIGAEHVALGVLRAGDPEVRRVLWQLSVDEGTLRADLEGRGRNTA